MLFDTRRLLSALCLSVGATSLFSWCGPTEAQTARDTEVRSAGGAEAQTAQDAHGPGDQFQTSKLTPKSGRAKVGLALGGGGSRGSAHVGVLKVLIEEGVPIDVIAGTSIGSVVGGFYSLGMSLDDLTHEFTKDTFIKEFIPLPIPVKLLVLPVQMIPRLFGSRPYDGVYPGIKFKKYVERITDNAVIEKLPIPFAAVCTNVVDGKSYRLTEGDLGQAMQASTAVPGLKKPIQIGDKLYCDGGLVCNVPAEHARALGADIVIAVNIDERLDDVPIERFKKMGSMASQALRIQLNNNDDRLTNPSDILIHPNTDGISLISRKRSDGVDGIASGAKAARAAMPEIRRKLLALGIELKPPAAKP